jgi:5'-3' exonuclease
MRVHLIDGTYELFRQHFGQVSRHGDAGPYDAAVGVVSSTLQLVAAGATHVGVASDHVIESFRNDLYAGYKSSEGMDEVLLHQIPVMEEVLVACGFTTWPMVEWEADDALAAAAAVADADPRVEQVLIITPDKDLGQCVKGTRVVQYDRRKDEIIDAAAVEVKFGVPPSSIADYLALVGDSADGFPGLPAGVRRAHPPCSPSSAASTPFPPPRATGACPACAAPRSWLAPCTTRWPMRCCSG